MAGAPGPFHSLEIAAAQTEPGRYVALLDARHTAGMEEIPQSIERSVIRRNIAPGKGSASEVLGRRVEHPGQNRRAPSGSHDGWLIVTPGERHDLAKIKAPGIRSHPREGQNTHQPVVFTGRNDRHPTNGEAVQVRLVPAGMAEYRGERIADQLLPFRSQCGQRAFTFGYLYREHRSSRSHRVPGENASVGPIKQPVSAVLTRAECVPAFRSLERGYRWIIFRSAQRRG